MTIRRFLSLWLPRLATDRARRLNGVDKRAPLAAVAKVNNARAARLRRRRGRAARPDRRPVARRRARALTRTSSRSRPQPAEEARLLERLCDWCSRFTPLAALDGRDGLMLDISGVAHLFGGEAALIEDCRARLAAQGFTVAAGVAGNPRAAWALARFSRAKIAPEPLSDKAFAKLFHDLPLAALGLDDKTVADMARAGLRRIGDIALRPRAPIAARFGPMPIARLDALKGLERSSIAPRFTPPDFCAERRFASPVQTFEAIEATLRKLADDLVVLLERQAKGARRIELEALSRRRRRAPHPRRRLPAAQRSARDRAALRRAAGEPGRRGDRRRLRRRPHAPLLPCGRAARAVASRARARARGRARPRARRSSRPAERAARGPRGDAARARRGASARTGRGGRAGDARARRGARGARRGARDRGRFAAARRRGRLRLFVRPEPIEALAEVPDGPPLRFRWRRVLHDVAAIEGPERIAAPWWRRAGRADARLFPRRGFSKAAASGSTAKASGAARRRRRNGSCTGCSGESPSPACGRRARPLCRRVRRNASPARPDEGRAQTMRSDQCDTRDIPRSASRAHALRAAPTEAERKLWRRLARSASAGAEISRQAPVGPYIVDFRLLEHRLVVEARRIATRRQRETPCATHWLARKATRSALLEPRYSDVRARACWRRSRRVRSWPFE